MFGKDFDASNSLNAEAMEILRGLLQQLRTKPASPEDWTKAANPQHWNLQQIAQAKRDVVAQYGGSSLPRTWNNWTATPSWVS